MKPLLQDRKDRKESGDSSVASLLQNDRIKGFNYSRRECLSAFDALAETRCFAYFVESVIPRNAVTRNRLLGPPSWPGQNRFVGNAGPVRLSGFLSPGPARVNFEWRTTQERDRGVEESRDQVQENGTGLQISDCKLQNAK